MKVEIYLAGEGHLAIEAGKLGIGHVYGALYAARNNDMGYCKEVVTGPEGNDAHIVFLRMKE
jgi:hypothetical protein